MDAEQELAKATPNGTRLRSLISAVSTGIRGVATLADLYKVLEVAQSMLGGVV